VTTNGMHWEWSGEVVPCNCGMILHEETLDPSGNHRKSIAHKRGKFIIEALKENNLSQMEIARQVGLSRERIRQIAMKTLGITGRERERERRRKNNDEKTQAS
jgi:hypothetical protein